MEYISERYWNIEQFKEGETDLVIRKGEEEKVAYK